VPKTSAVVQVDLPAGTDRDRMLRNLDVEFDCAKKDLLAEWDRLCEEG